MKDNHRSPKDHQAFNQEDDERWPTNSKQGSMIGHEEGIFGEVVILDGIAPRPDGSIWTT
ncbi:MAG: hypothetical protein ACE5NG_10580 [bacterium]